MREPDILIPRATYIYPGYQQYVTAPHMERRCNAYFFELEYYARTGSPAIQMRLIFSPYTLKDDESSINSRVTTLTTLAGLGLSQAVVGRLDQHSAFYGLELNEYSSFPAAFRPAVVLLTGSVGNEIEFELRGCQAF